MWFLQRKRDTLNILDLATSIRLASDNHTFWGLSLTHCGHNVDGMNIHPILLSDIYPD